MSVFTKPSAAPVAQQSHTDRSAQMRRGHPQIKAGDDYLTGLFRKHLARRNGNCSVLVAGAGSGYYPRQLAETFPGMKIFAHEDYPAALAALQQRLAGSRVQVRDGPFEQWTDPVDVVLSWGAHHHLPRGYLDHTRRILKPGGSLIVGDEFCPEYCHGVHATRIKEATVLYLANGYVLTRAEEVAAFESRGEIPRAAEELELLRRRALWTWYRYVIDSALERDCLDVALYELRATRDDLDTACGEEHKMSPLLLEQELDLHGFMQQSRHCVDDSVPAELQSFFIYEYTPTDSSSAARLHEPTKPRGSR